jgi:hypothetical protein
MRLFHARNRFSEFGTKVEVFIRPVGCDNLAVATSVCPAPLVTNRRRFILTPYRCPRDAAFSTEKAETWTLGAVFKGWRVSAALMFCGFKVRSVESSVSDMYPSAFTWTSAFMRCHVGMWGRREDRSA